MIISKLNLIRLLDSKIEDYRERPLYIGLQHKPGNIQIHDLITEHPEHLKKWKEIKIPITPADEYLLYSDIRPEKTLKDCVKPLPTKGINLNPMDTLIVRSREFFWFGGEYGGRIVTPVPLTWLGISNISTPLDPGFEGYLTITLTNLGGYSLKLYPFDMNLVIGYAIIEEVNADSNETKLQPEHERPQTESLEDILASSTEYYKYFPYTIRKRHDPRDVKPKELKSELRHYAEWKGLPYDAINLLLGHVDNRLLKLERMVKSIYKVK